MACVDLNDEQRSLSLCVVSLSFLSSSVPARSAVMECTQDRRYDLALVLGISRYMIAVKAATPFLRLAEGPELMQAAV